MFPGSQEYQHSHFFSLGDDVVEYLPLRFIKAKKHERRIEPILTFE